MASTSHIATWPNLLSLLRAALGPLVMVLLMTGGVSLLAGALVLMALAEFSDWADGWLARRLQLDPGIGRLVDLAADTVYHLAVYTAFLANGWLSPMVLFLLFAQELIVPYMRTFGLQRGRPLEIRWSARAKTVADGVCQIAVVAAVILFFLDDPTSGARAATALISIAVLASLLTTVDHAIAGYDLWSRS